MDSPGSMEPREKDVISKKRIAVIGAGMTGLCTLRHFSVDPQYDIVAFERSNVLAGIWNYPDQCEEKTDDTGTEPHYCRIYRGLRYVIRSRFGLSKTLLWTQCVLALFNPPYPGSPPSDFSPRLCHWRSVCASLVCDLKWSKLCPLVLDAWRTSFGGNLLFGFASTFCNLTKSQSAYRTYSVQRFVHSKSHRAVRLRPFNRTPRSLR